MPSAVAYSEGSKQDEPSERRGEYMNHTLRISVQKEPLDGGIVGCRKVDMRERLLRFLLGKKQRLTILVPGDSVRSLSIVEEGGNPDGKDE
jgi:hypothetical protein